MVHAENTLIFARKVVVATILILTTAVGLGVHLAHVAQPDEVEYYQLLASSEASAERQKSKGVSGMQGREDVRKMVVLSEPSGRRMLRLQSERSELQFQVGHGKGEVVEKLEGVTCDMQEELFYLLADGREARLQGNSRLLVVDADPLDPSAWYDMDDVTLTPQQRVRHVDADSATYYYKDDLLVAEEVALIRFSNPSHHLLETWAEAEPTMRGLARSVQFSMAGRDPSFKADHLQLTLYSQEGLR